MEQTRRERRIERQRKAIMDAAAGLFAQKGYQATTTKDIAEAVDVGESTLYGYFSSKKEVLQAILSHQAEMVDSLLVHILEIKDLQSFVDLVDLLMEKILSRTVYNRVLIAEAWTDDEVLQAYVITHWKPVMQTLQNFISMKTESGIFRPVDPALGARLIVASFIAAILPVLRGVEPPPSPAERHQLATMIVEIISNGLNIRKG
jgi:AcrR family transcriptional regulator